MKKTEKQRLFEVMNKLNPEFTGKNNLNEWDDALNASHKDAMSDFNVSPEEGLQNDLQYYASLDNEPVSDEDKAKFQNFQQNLMKLVQAYTHLNRKYKPHGKNSLDSVLEMILKSAIHFAEHNSYR
jgi:t-SNARE complex subunit (syntaxin)